MTTATWYYAAGEAQNGPFTPDQIRGLLRDRVVDRDTYVWSPAMKDWAPLAQTELAALLGAPPPRPPGAPPAPPAPASAAASSASGVGTMGAPLAGPRPAGSGSLASLTGGKIPEVDLGAMGQGNGFPAVMLRAARTCIQAKYVDFQGRASRPEYWWYQLFVFGLMVAALIVDAILAKIIGIGLVYYLLALALFLPGLGAAVRRLHDTNRSGWWLLISLVPFVGAVVLIVFLCLPSDQGDNRFGPPPQPV